MLPVLDARSVVDVLREGRYGVAPGEMQWKISACYLEQSLGAAVSIAHAS